MVGREPGDLFPPCAGRPHGRHRRRRSQGFCRRRGARASTSTCATARSSASAACVGQGQEDLLLGLYGAICRRSGRRCVERIGARRRLPGRVGAANAPGSPMCRPTASARRCCCRMPIALQPDPAGAAPAGPARRARRCAPRRGSAAELVAELGIKGDVRDGRCRRCPAATSRRWRSADGCRSSPRVLLLNDPTRGVDVETKREIYLRAARAWRPTGVADRAAELRHAGTGASLRPRRGVPRRPDRRHCCTRTATERGGDRRAPRWACTAAGGCAA